MHCARDESAAKHPQKLCQVAQAHHSRTPWCTGDADQLPPVGPGTVLEAALQSGVVPVINLQQIFRQASNSAIISCAHAVNAGQFPGFSQAFIPAPKQVCLSTLQLVKARSKLQSRRLHAGLCAALATECCFPDSL